MSFNLAVGVINNWPPPPRKSRLHLYASLILSAARVSFKLGFGAGIL